MESGRFKTIQGKVMYTTGKAPLQMLKIGAGGAMFGLHFKHKGFDFSGMGDANVVRVTDIVWDDNTKCWSITFLQGKLKGKSITEGLLKEYGVPLSLFAGTEVDEATGRLVYKAYEAAVGCEIMLVQFFLVTSRRNLVMEG